MRRGFTLLELIVVVIILGILATLGLAQYTRMIERSRGAEARQVLGSLRTQAAALYFENVGTPAATECPVGTITAARLGIGNTAGKIPNVNPCGAGAPSSGYYFWYNAGTVIGAGLGEVGVVLTATRCTAGGKPPAAVAADTLILTSNFQANTDVFTGTGGY